MKNIYLICGRSGSGKTTVSELLEKEYNMKSVQSYTTRPKRYSNESGHTFISKEEFDKLDMVAYTLFNGYEYGVTKDIINKSDLYVIDIPGIHTLETNYFDKPLRTINLKCDKEELKHRMHIRGDSDESIESRLLNDDKMFEEENTFKFDLVVDCNVSAIDTANIIYNYIMMEEK